MTQQKSTAFRLGLISDTHNLLRPEALQALQGVDEIWHAGDHGSLSQLDELRKLAPLEYVSGNIDGWAEPLRLRKSIAGHEVYMLHRIADLDLDPVAEGISLVVYGHSHKPALEVRDGVTYLNPGAAGRKRFSLPISVAVVEFRAGGFEVEFLNLLDERVLP